MLELDALHRRYGDNVALDGLTFTVEKGEVVGFLGPNGAGKTTAMRAVLGIVRPDSGEVRWNGSVADLNARLQFGYIPEERGLYPTMKLVDQLSFLAQLHGYSKDRALDASMYWLTMLGLGDRANDRLDSLSMGNQQRVQLAAALVHEPELLVLDEPFSGLDPTGIEALSEVLAERARDGVAVVFSSHQLDLVEGLCERVVIINKGRNVLQGDVGSLTTTTDVLLVRVADNADGSWASLLRGVEIQDIENGVVRIALNGSHPDDVLRSAQAAGSVQHFSFARKRLSDVFRDAVS